MSKDQHPAGGDLSDMAASGTSVPTDSAKPKLVPSVPEPHQKAENPAFHNQFINAADPQGAVDNAADMPRTFKDTGATGEVITATGDQMPADVEAKRFGLRDAGGDAAKGHSREGRGTTTHKEDDIEKFATEGAEVDRSVQEEGEDVGQDELRAKKGL